VNDELIFAGSAASFLLQALTFLTETTVAFAIHPILDGNVLCVLAVTADMVNGTVFTAVKRS
jgi:hypothetical protein